jgi:hypothetical protein
MGSIFLLLIGLYICNFVYNTLGLSSNSIKLNFNPSKYIDIFIGIIDQIYKWLVKNLLLLIKKINLAISKSQKYLPILASRNYILIAIVIHILLLFACGKYIVFDKVEHVQEWVYVEMSTKDIEDKAILDSAPIESNDSIEPDFVENSQDNDSNSSSSCGIDVVSEKVNLPTEVMVIAPAPVIISHFSKKPIHFVTAESKEQIKSGKQVIYEEGKVDGVNGYSADGLGSILGGNGSGHGNGGNGFGSGSGGNGFKEGKVFGSNIKAKKLGVLFDISFSMRPYTERVENEIRKNFPNAVVSYVDGCVICPETRVFRAFEELAMENVDAIYWFCDLQDPETKDGLYLLQKLLVNKKIKLYIKSMDQHPNSTLKSIISSTGGNYSFGLN